MTEWARLYYQFWSTAIPFEDGYLPFFLEQDAPAALLFPYGTYTLSRGGMLQSTREQIKIWTKGPSTTQLMDLLCCAEKALPESGVILRLPDSHGAAVLYRDTPFIQKSPAESPDIQAGSIHIEIRSYFF